MADDESRQIGQEEIEQLLKQSKPAGAPPGAASTPSETVEQGPLQQAEIESLLEQRAQAQSAGTANPARDVSEAGHEATEAGRGGGPAPTVRTGHAPGSIAPGDLEMLLSQAERALASLDEPLPGAPSGARPFELSEFSGAAPSTDVATLELLRDVELDLRIEFGRTHMHLEDVLKLRKGSVVALDKLAGDPVDIFVNGRLIARGEVLVLNDNFCVRVAELVAGESVAAP